MEMQTSDALHNSGDENDNDSQNESNECVNGSNGCDNAIDMDDSRHSRQNEENAIADEKTYHFRKGSDLDGFDAFGSLFANGLFTDLAICCHGKVFRCHRVVMAASSDYIKKALSAFSSDNSNTVMIMPEDIRVADMEAILHFIYNGQVEVTRDQMEAFLRSSKILQVKGLANIKLVYNRNRERTNSNHINAVNANLKRKNGMSFENRIPLRNDLNLSPIKANPHTSSFHSTFNNFNNNGNNVVNNTNDHNISRRKQSFPNRKRKTTPIVNDVHQNGYINETSNDDAHSITIEDEEEDERKAEESANDDNKLMVEMAANENELNDTTNETAENEELSDSKVNGNEEHEMEENSPRKEGEDESALWPCHIQIDADPTTFPSFCAESIGNGVKRRRSSSVRSELKPITAGPLMPSKHLRKPFKVDRSARKLGLMPFHKNTFINSGKWKCEICNKLYGNKQTLKEHIDYFHTNKSDQIYTCNICNKEYTWMKSLKKHQRDIHSNSPFKKSLVKVTPSPTVTSANSSQNQ